MLFTGFFAVIVGLTWSVYLDQEPVDVIEEWRDSCIFDADTCEMDRIERALSRFFWWTIFVCIVLVLLATVIGYREVYSKGIPLNEFTAASFLCAVSIGLRLSRLMMYVVMSWTLTAQKVRFFMVVEHSDGAGGFAQIGRFYLVQTSVLVVPAVWLAYWLWKISSSGTYTIWVAPFSAFIVFVSVIFCLAFWLPIGAFRKQMIDLKCRHVRPEIERVRKELLDLVDVESPNADNLARRQALLDRVQALTGIPDWPASPGTLRTFLAGFVVLLMPVILEYGISIGLED